MAAKKDSKTIAEYTDKELDKLAEHVQEIKDLLAALREQRIETSQLADDLEHALAKLEEL